MPRTSYGEIVQINAEDMPRNGRRIAWSQLYPRRGDETRDEWRKRLRAMEQRHKRLLPEYRPT